MFTYVYYTLYMYDYRYESITQVYDLTILSNFISLGFFFSWVDTDMHLVNFVSQIVI